MKEKELIGYWHNKEIDIILKPKARANIIWHNPKRKATGLWNINENKIFISYVFNGIEQITSEFKLNGKKYERKETFCIISFNENKLELIDSSNWKLELFNSVEKTSKIFINEEKKKIYYKLIL